MGNEKKVLPHNTCATALLYLVEMRRVELLSENPSPQLSTSVDGQ